MPTGGAPTEARTRTLPSRLIMRIRAAGLRVACTTGAGVGTLAAATRTRDRRGYGTSGIGSSIVIWARITNGGVPRPSHAESAKTTGASTAATPSVGLVSSVLCASEARTAVPTTVGAIMPWGLQRGQDRARDGVTKGDAPRTDFPADDPSTSSHS